MLFDNTKFKSNSVFIIPSIVSNLDLFTTNAFKFSKILDCNDLKYLKVYYEPISTSQYGWLYYKSELEQNLYNIVDEIINDKKYIVATYNIPKNKFLLCNLISKNGYDALTKKDIIKIVLFWKNVAADILDFFECKNPDRS